MARTNLKVTDGIAIDFYDDGNSNKGSIYLDNGAFVFSGTSGGDVVIGEVGNGADLVFEESSTIHGQGGNTLTFGQSGDSIAFAVDTTFNNNIDSNGIIRLSADGSASDNFLSIGDGDDFKIYHDSNDTRIRNFTGNLVIANDGDDKDIIFQNDNNSGGTTDWIALDGSAYTTLFKVNTRHEDNIRLYWGSDNDTFAYYNSSTLDYEIQHSGDMFYITHSGGVGSNRKIALNLRNQIVFQDRADSNAELFSFDMNARTMTVGKDNDGVSVNFYGDGAGEYITLFRNWDYTAGNKTTLKLMTADQSAYIVGHRTAANVGSDLYFDVTNTGGTRTTLLTLQEDEIIDIPQSKLSIGGATGSSGQVLTTDGSGNISWSTVSGGGGGGDVYLANSQTFTGDNTFSGKIKLNLDGTTGDNYISVGAGDDLKIYHTGSQTYFYNTSGYIEMQSTTGNEMIFNQTSSDAAKSFVFKNIPDGSNKSVQVSLMANQFYNSTNNYDTRMNLGINTGTTYAYGYLQAPASQSTGSTETMRFYNTVTMFLEDSRHQDNVKAYFGSNNDTEIYHDDTDGHIVNSKGHLDIINSGSDIRLQSAGNVTIELDTNQDGNNYFRIIDGNDNTDFIVGENLTAFPYTYGIRYYYDVTSNYDFTTAVTDDGIQFSTASNTRDFKFKAGSAGNTQLQIGDTQVTVGVTDGEVPLAIARYSNTSATTYDDLGVIRPSAANAGIGIDSHNGSAFVKTLEITKNQQVRLPIDGSSSSGYLSVGAGHDLKLYHASNNSYVINTAVGGLYLENAVTDGGIFLRADKAGSQANYVWIDGSDEQIKMYSEVVLNQKALYLDVDTDETIQYYSSSPNRGIKYDAKGNSGGWYGTHLFFTGYNGSASAERLRITDSGIQIGGTGATVDSILDEDDMSSNDSAALATQQSIKAYVDANAVPAYRGASGFDETIYEMDLTGFANADVPHFVTSDSAYEEIDTNNYVIVDTSQASSISGSPAISDSKSLKFRRYTEPHSSIAWSMPMKEAAFNFTIEFDIKVSGSNWLRGTYLYFQGWFYDSANDHVTRKTIFYLRKHAYLLEVLGATSAKTLAQASANNAWVRVKVECEANNGGAGTNYGKLRASLSTSDTDSFGSTVNWNYTTDESHKMIPTMGFRLATSRGNSSSSYYDELWIDNLTVRTKEGQLL